MTEIAELTSFKLIVLKVIASFVRDSLDETISLTEMTSLINKNPLISLAREYIQLNNLTKTSNGISETKTTSTNGSVSIRDVIIALMSMFQGTEIKILENKDKFKLRLSREAFDSMVRKFEKEYDDKMETEIKQNEAEYERLKREENLSKKEELKKEEMAQGKGEKEEIKINKKLVVIANQLIDSITSLKYSSAFVKPVDDSVAPNYHKLIKHPTNLKLIRAKVKDGSIQTKVELQREIMLMYANAIMYNKSNTDVYEWSLEMMEKTDELWKLLEDS